MRYTKPFNVWTATELQLARTQPGQWVYAGTPDCRGRFMGISASGVTVIAWNNHHTTMQRLRQFALGT
jgi:hypothetical protein